MKSLRVLEKSLAMVADCGCCEECGGLSFVIWNWDNPDEDGTVRIDGEGNVIHVEGILACASCFELYDPEAASQEPELRLVEGGK